MISVHVSLEAARKLWHDSDVNSLASSAQREVNRRYKVAWPGWARRGALRVVRRNKSMMMT